MVRGTGWNCWCLTGPSWSEVAYLTGSSVLKHHLEAAEQHVGLLLHRDLRGAPARPLHVRRLSGPGRGLGLQGGRAGLDVLRGLGGGFWGVLLGVE